MINRPKKPWLCFVHFSVLEFEPILLYFLLAISGLFFVVSTRICWCRRWARWPLDYRQTRSPNFLIIMSFQSDSNPRLLTSLQLPFIIVWQIFCWENVAKLLKCLKTILHHRAFFGCYAFFRNLKILKLSSMNFFYLAVIYRQAFKFPFGNK